MLQDNVILHSSEEFYKHEIIKPSLQHGRHKRDIVDTRLENGFHADELILRYKDVIIDLKLNDNLIPQGHFMRYQLPNGTDVVQHFTKTDIDLCHYKGTIRNNVESHVAISTCDGIKGVIFDGDETYYIDTKHNGNISDEHFLYRHSDRKANQTQRMPCGFEKHHHSVPEASPASLHDSAIKQTLRYKRSADTVIRGPYNANRHSSFVELVLVVDNKVYKSLGENLKKVHSHCKDIANIMNALYVPLNIFIALVGIVVWNENNEAELSSDGDKTLKNFLKYRREVLVTKHPNDNAQLLTKEQFEGGVVGKALKGPICTYEYSGGVSMDHSQIVSVVATTVAHEMGHNFGMEHDTPDCKCKEDRCIMSASSSSVAPFHWSSCSIDQLNLAFHRGMNYCLRNKPTQLFDIDSPQCGNGFVEPGEQCDCGLPDFCQNSCCNPNTCMLHSNASCATGECCDLTTCHPRTAGTVCRTADGECDLPEYCTGESEYCPPNYFKRDTELCDGGKAYCYEGSCQSHTDQCKLLWGPSGHSMEECYIKNLEGTRHGNCGYDRLNSTYRNCSREDIMCGLLQCRHLNEILEFGMESVALLSHSFITHKKQVIPCRTAIIDLGLQSVDPGLTPNGAICGDGKMCIRQKCLSIVSLRASGIGLDCPENCNGHGTCDNKGHCHCDNGFAPPTCSTPGHGGSGYSGPAANPNEGSGFVRIMYVFFLGVVPFLILASLFLYYWKQNKPFFMSKTPNLFKSSNTSAQNRSGSGNGGHSSTSPAAGKTSTPSSTDDMNSSLLKSGENVDSNGVNNNIPYGRFKGYTLKPLPISRTPQINAPNVAFVHPVSKIVSETTNVPNGAPNRIAPPVPKPPNIARSQTQIKPVKPIVNRSNSVLPSKYSSEVAPALPPMNPGATARPLISSPILEASTCSAKELISPLRHNAEKYADKVPVRPAPSVPIQPTTITDTNTNQSRIDVVQNLKKAKDGTIKRIALLLKKDEKAAGASILSRNPSKSLDREKLRNIQISAPITADLSSDGEQEPERSFVNRTQSMRDPSNAVVKRPTIQTFGSMRQPGSVKRPGSIVGSRPKSPPPPRPPAPSTGQPNVQPGTKVCNEYDSCEAVEAPLAQIVESSPTNSDNIYAVIEEYQSPAKIPIPVEKADSSGIGLLSEIVNEIENRNLDSIYSVTTLNRKKSTDTDPVATYANTSDFADSSANEYINLTPSTTSSGYLRPTSINAPIARVSPVKPSDLPTKPVTNNLSSFGKKDVDSNGGSGGSDGNKKIIKKQSSDAASKPPSANKTTAVAPTQVHFNRTKTPPNIQTNSIRKRSPSPTTQSASNKKPITNAVKSTPSTKANVKPKTPAKPSAINSNEPSLHKPKWQTTNSKDRTVGGVTTAGANFKTNSAKSNVASLQQKFESAGCSNIATLK
ncbi:disintegrin and metalloproteinase domain-containing protein 12 isoform X2 [Bradysia coprophila]|uniref:disintegrin and metalloproteinase domain-containing protein 12 isoform X2 n=1 Tax=Bradysia coprophila TaxID=38358 RepID=UPI00187DAD92|nr:disintegrin and metalloproteinase domain-containing protein 12 isoform X2 [Bradysia coprophila]